MLQPACSQIALSTIADYLSAPATYNAEASWQKALTQWGLEYQKLLENLALATRDSCCGRGSPLQEIFSSANSGGLPPTTASLNAIRAWASVTTDHFPPSLQHEITPWLTKLQALGRWVSAIEDHDAEGAQRNRIQVKDNPSAVYSGAVETWLEHQTAG